MFYESYSASDYSFASFIGVLALLCMIFINNKLQAKLGVHKVYFFTGLLTIVVMLLSFYFYQRGVKEMAFVLFATKEAYIVLLIHICLAFSNSFYELDLFKVIIGPIGAIGSIGGIIGGQLTSFLAKQEGLGTEVVFIISLVIILLTVISFYQTRKAKIRGLSVTGTSSITPLRAVSGVRRYVILIASIVALSQFVIFIADLQFNMVFEKVVTLKDERTAYLGQFYSYINIISLFLQFIVLPYLLSSFSLRSIFLFIPVLYLIVVFGGLGLGSAQILVVATVFITMKGVDYSLFSAAKEVMYHPLLSLQKFGAKYITDMFVYRLAKALIAIIMAQSIFQSMQVLSILQFVFLGLWVVLIIQLFKEQKRLKH
jgi:AAA family ATP:ADP antiporter